MSNAAASRRGEPLARPALGRARQMPSPPPDFTRLRALAAPARRDQPPRAIALPPLRLPCPRLYRRRRRLRRQRLTGRSSSIQRRGRRYLKSHWRNKDEHDYDEGRSHDILQGLGKGPANRFLARLAVIVRRLGCPDDVFFESRILRR